ncbi:hypothetical protein GGI42DRAFT_354611 [Trichoderma sp. SZMC 28013]
MDDKHYSSDQQDESYLSDQQDDSFLSAQSDNSGYVSGGFSKDPDQRLHSEAPQPSSEYSYVPPNPANNIALSLSGRVISVTFTIPYTLRGPGGQDRAWFDILSHLSSAKSTQKHLIIGWTGEMSGTDATHSHPNGPSPWLSNDPNTLAQPRDNAFVSHYTQQLIDHTLSNAGLATETIWMASSSGPIRNGFNLGDQAR